MFAWEPLFTAFISHAKGTEVRSLLLIKDPFRFSTGFDQSLLSNIQKLFSEKIEIFSAVEFSKVSILTGIIKITLKVYTFIAGFK